MSAEELTKTSQYLTFTLGDEAFAVEISNVREVVDYTHITEVPRMPDHLCGVINLRGNVVSVVDLRLKLGMRATEKTVDSCIVIAELEMDGETLQMGILTDSVQEVVDFDSSQIEPTPKIGTKLNTEFINGVGKRGEDFIIILNLDKVLSESDLLSAHQPSGEMLAGSSESE